MEDIKIQIVLSPNGMFGVNHNARSGLLAVGIMTMAVIKEVTQILNPPEQKKVIPFSGPIPEPPKGH